MCRLLTVLLALAPGRENRNTLDNVNMF